MFDAVQSTPASIRSCASGHYIAFSVKSCLMLSNQPPRFNQVLCVCLAITVPSLSSHAWCWPIHPHFNQVLCVWPLQRLLCQVMLDDVQTTPTSIRYCASGHYSAFSVKSCLMMSNPPPHQSGLVHLAITVPSLSSLAWWYPIHPHINQVLCVWPLQCLLCQVMLDAVQSTPLQSGLVRLAITVPSLSSHAWWCPIHPHFNQVLCIWPLQCLLSQVMLDAVQPTPASIRYCASGHYSAFSVKSCLMLANPPHFNQVLCIWPLQCLLCQVMLDAVQSTPASIRSCASGHHSPFSVKSCLMLSNPPPFQSGLVLLAIVVPSLSSHAWCSLIHPRFNQVLCIWPL